MSLMVVTMVAVPDRFRGFAATIMSEVATGVFVSDRITAAVRDRVYAVFDEWASMLEEGSMVAVYSDKADPGGLAIRYWGMPRKSLVDFDGVLGLRRS